MSVAIETVWADYGLSFRGTVTGIVGAPKFQCSDLVGFGNDYFEGYWAYVVWDADGAGAAPQGQKLVCTGYDSVGGDFTVAAFTPAIAVGDKVLLIHPRVAEIADIKTQTDKIAGKMLFSMDFWSAPQEEVLLSDIAAPGTDVQLPSVTVAGLPNGATIVRAVAMFKFRIVENTAAGVNKLQGGQHIQVEDDGPGTLRDAISLLDDMFTLAATPCREGGDVLIGDHDISVEVDGLDTYLFFWTASLVDAANLQFNDVQVGLRIWYSV